MSQLTTEICISEKGYSVSAPFARSTLLHSYLGEYSCRSIGKIQIMTVPRLATIGPLPIGQITL